jgi:hypothetical protein
MASSIQFKKGDPVRLRATTQIHLGKIERYINEDDVVEFDGQTLDLGGGETHNIPQLRGAVISGWLVEAGDTTTKYVPQPADIKLRPALAADQEHRGVAVKVEQVEHEERVVGTVGTPAEAEDRGASGEGVPVGRIQTPAVQTPIVKDSASAQREASRLDSTTPPKVELTATATGDVDTPMTGETLTDILPNAATGAVPAAMVAKAGKKTVRLANGDDWDMGRHWRTRARDALRRYSSDSAGLEAVKAVEVPSVHKFIAGRLGE